MSPDGSIHDDNFTYNEGSTTNQWRNVKIKCCREFGSMGILMPEGM